MSDKDKTEASEQPDEASVPESATPSAQTTPEAQPKHDDPVDTEDNVSDTQMAQAADKAAEQGASSDDETALSAEEAALSSDKTALSLDKTASSDEPVEAAAEDDAKQPAAKQKKDKTKAAKKSSKAPWLIGTVVLLAVILALVCFVMNALGQRQQQDFERQIMGLQEQLQELRSQIAKTDEQGAAVQQAQNGLQNKLGESVSALNSKLSKLQQADAKVARDLDAQNKQVDMLQQRVDGQQERLMGMSTTSREDWLLAEAEYLLRLANQRVMLERSASNAIALLQAADKIIAQVAGGLGDADLFAIRQAIARELAALKLVPEVDKDGLYLQLQALAEQAGKLPRVPANSLLGGGEAPAAEEDAEAWWPRIKQELRAVAGVLDQYIKIDDIEAPPNPLVDSHIAQIVGLNLRIAMEQAQVALLREESDLYQRSLNEASALVDKYFIESPAAEQYLAQLEQLKGQNVAPQLPDISQSLQLLDGYLVRLHRLEPQAEGQL